MTLASKDLISFNRCSSFWQPAQRPWDRSGQFPPFSESGELASGHCLQHRTQGTCPLETRPWLGERILGNQPKFVMG